MIPFESIAGHPDFVPLSAISGIAVDLRYASVNNFAGRILYRDIDCAWLQKEAAAGLQRAAHWLAERRPGTRLLVLDALRPQRVQEQLWAMLAGTPMERYLAHPERGSIHSYGMAVDVTLINAQGHVADMGSEFDAMCETSHPALDAEHFALGILKPDHLQERGWLHATLRANGFHGIPYEWWHFNFGDAEQIRRQHQRVL